MSIIFETGKKVLLKSAYEPFEFHNDYINNDVYVNEDDKLHNGILFHWTQI